MNEYIYIHNFGPIKDVEIKNIRPVTVMIGSSGSGKSTIMKVLSIFRWMFKEVNIRRYLQDAGVTKNSFKFDFKSYLKISGIEEFLKKDTIIVYNCGSFEFRYDQKLSIKDNDLINELSLEKICFITEKRYMLSDLLALRSNQKDASYYLQETMDDFQTSMKFIDELNIPYLGVKLIKVKDHGVMRYRIVSTDDTDGEKFNIGIEDASSGIQTMIPLLAILKYYSEMYDIVIEANRSVFKNLSDTDELSAFRPNMNIGDMPNRRINFFVEEPELSLDPESQTKLMDFIAEQRLVNDRVGKSVMLATHSPYIVNYLNLLIANAKKGKRPSIAYDDIDVYQVANGNIYSLNVDDMQIINTTVMSDTISRIYKNYNS